MNSPGMYLMNPGHHENVNMGAARVCIDPSLSAQPGSAVPMKKFLYIMVHGK